MEEPIEDFAPPENLLAKLVKALWVIVVLMFVLGFGAALASRQGWILYFFWVPFAVLLLTDKISVAFDSYQRSYSSAYFKLRGLHEYTMRLEVANEELKRQNRFLLRLLRKARTPKGEA